MFCLRCLGTVLLACCTLSIHADPPTKPEIKMTRAEKEIFDLINLERKKKDLRPLKVNLLLIKIARDHSANMAKQGKLEHDLDGKKAAKRILDAGYDYLYTGENIAENMGFPAKAIVKDWMDSEKHRKNILYPEYTETGVGIVADKNGLLKYTQVFGKPRK
jgi:uncharacterized protein YkwD